MVNFLSPEEVWENVETSIEDFDFSKQREYETELGDFSEFYFNGKKLEDGCVRIFAVLACPKNIENPKVVLVCHDISSSIDTTYIDFFLKQGFAVMMCDTFGEFEGRKYTFYPDSIKYANKVHSKGFLYETSTSPRENAFFEWTEVYRYALEFLKGEEGVDGHSVGVVGVREGAVSAWHLSFLKEVKCAAALYYAGWKEYGNNFKYSLEPEPELSKEQIAYSAGIAPQSYAPLVKTPFLFLTASNNELSNLDRAFDTMARLNGAVESLTSISPNSLNLIGYFSTRNLKLFLQKYLADLAIEIPEKPIISVENLGGKLFVRCDVSSELTPLSVVIYHSEGSFNPMKRCWRAKVLAKGTEGYSATIDIEDSKERTYIFATVEFKNGFAASSNFLAVEPEELGIDTPLEKDNLIYNGLMGIDTFTGMSRRIGYGAEELFADRRIVELCETFDGIYGVTSSRNLATFKLSIPKFRGEEDDILVMDVFSENAQIVKAVITQNLGEKNEKHYSADLKTVGGPLWQNFKLEACDFLDANNLGLENWEEVSLLMFVSESQFVLNNMLWI